jgi:hypothetical protein
MILSPRLHTLLQPGSEDQAAEVLRCYFTPRPVGRFTGAHFERLGGGGDRPEIADEFTAEDLIAVSMLSVSVVGDAALEILTTRQRRLHELLRVIPTDVALADLPAADLGDAWPVRSIYRELLSILDIGETTACKLLARKRPHLVPILDSVVTKELSIVHGLFWLPLHDWLAAGDRANHLHLESLRSKAGLGPNISVLRVFDVLTWMTGKGYANP